MAELGRLTSVVAGWMTRYFKCRETLDDIQIGKPRADIVGLDSRSGSVPFKRRSILAALPCLVQFNYFFFFLPASFNDPFLFI
jgi:hypothetical protein